MLERVVANAQKAASIAGDCKIIVATDDDRIADHARELNATAMMTDARLDSGSARAHAAALGQSPTPARVICLQGDAPFISPQIIVKLLQALRESSSAIATPVFQLDWERLDRLRLHKRNAPFSGTTCLRDSAGRALWFSKTIMPALRNEDALRQQLLSPVWQHLGLYAYTMAALDWFVSAATGTYEGLEGLEQLRFLENGWTIATVPVPAPEHALSGIDTPEDLALAEEAVARLGDPFPG